VRGSTRLSLAPKGNTLFFRNETTKRGLDGVLVEHGSLRRDKRGKLKLRYEAKLVTGSGKSKRMVIRRREISASWRRAKRAQRLVMPRARARAAGGGAQKQLPARPSPADDDWAVLLSKN
jgi:hypothetical protein